jgi:hypothetical protein
MQPYDQSYNNSGLNQSKYNTLIDLGSAGYQILTNSYMDQTYYSDRQIATQQYPINHDHGVNPMLTNTNTAWSSHHGPRLACSGISSHPSQQFTSQQMATLTPHKQAPMYNGHSPVPSPLIDQISVNQTTPIPPPPPGNSSVSNSQQPAATPTTAVIPTTQPKKQKQKRKSAATTSTDAPVSTVVQSAKSHTSTTLAVNSNKDTTLASSESPTGTPKPCKKDTKLSDEVMDSFKDHTLHQLPKLQKTHVKYTQLNEEIKIAAQDVYFEYQQQLHLLSLKHQRPFKGLAKYLGQCRTRQKKSVWHKFQLSGQTAQKEYHQSR